MNRNFFLGTAFFILLLYSCQDNTYQQGEILYQNFCSNCHADDGTGLEGVIPPLVTSDYWKENRDQLACIIRYGLTDTIEVNGKTYHQKMAGIPRLSDFEIANVLNFIEHEWQSEQQYFKIQEVQASLKACEDWEFIEE